MRLVALIRIADPVSNNCRKPEPDPYKNEKLDPYTQKGGARGSKWSHWEPYMLIKKAWRLKMRPWRFCRPEVADSHHVNEGQSGSESALEIVGSGSAFKEVLRREVQGLKMYPVYR